MFSQMTFRAYLIKNIPPLLFLFGQCPWLWLHSINFNLKRLCFVHTMSYYVGSGSIVLQNKTFSISLFKRIFSKFAKICNFEIVIQANDAKLSIFQLKIMSPFTINFEWWVTSRYVNICFQVIPVYFLKHYAKSDSDLHWPVILKIFPS